MKFCFIYNKKASSGRKSNFIKKICNNLKLSHHVDLFETVTEKEAEDLFKQIVKQDYDRLVVAGGDGSVCFAINQLIKNNFQPKENFAIGYVPAGTANILQAELQSCTIPLLLIAYTGQLEILGTSLRRREEFVSTEDNIKIEVSISCKEHG